jgi:uracil-DNA glycosylase family 4
MSGVYQELLETTIRHLESLKASGARFVPVSKETLNSLEVLKARPAKPAPTAAPRPTPAVTAKAPQVAPRAKPLEQKPVQAESLSLALPGQTPKALPVLGLEAKAAAFADLRQRALACVRCSNLVAARKNVVFGVGDINAQLMFVGEAPGADEDEQGEPFVGRAGQLLTKIIQAMGLRRETVYIGNILKCRPDTPGQSAGNRKPTPAEMQTCIPYLHEQIDLIQPKVLVALGATAVEGLLGKTMGITKLRGNWKVYRGIPLMPTYHPAYLLRNQLLSEKRVVWEDMLKVMEKLEMEISSKQRNFFLKGS